MLNELDRIPQGLLELQAQQLADALQGPTLITLRGMREPPLFVSVLLHGNETTGWEAVRRLLREYEPGGGVRPLPRTLVLFIGNVDAARHRLRRLDGQPDYNRSWPGGKGYVSAETSLMDQVTALMRQRGLFASIDIHNNTGLNPHYACVNVVNNRFLRLATLFSRLVIYFIRPRGVQSLAFAKFCPAVTIECGKVGDAAGIRHTQQFVDACLHLHDLSDENLAHTEVDLFHTVATVKIPVDLEFGFGAHHQLGLDPQLERFNFSELPVGTHWGDTNGEEMPFVVTSESGELVAEDYFELQQGRLVNCVPVMPSMLTRDERVIRQDCLCYLMERYKLKTRQAAN
ncbi:MAG: M14 family metallopeptidase [Pseudomonadota bacterium]